jgi:Tetratricopeptide repeat
MLTLSKHREHSSIFWVYAGNANRFLEAYKRIASTCDIPGRDLPELDVMELVRSYLEDRYRFQWLMIVDNVDDASFFGRNKSTDRALSDYVPKGPKGSILYTTRSRDVAMDLTPDKNPIGIPFMNPTEARALLGGNFLGLTPEQIIMELLEELDRLPLAIAQASAYIQKRQMGVAEYLETYRNSNSFKIVFLSHEFVDQSKGPDAKPKDSVAATWMLSFNYIKSVNSRAADLLCLISFLDRQRIPISLLTPGDEEDSGEIYEAIGILEAFSLVVANKTDHNYDMHRLVQVATRAWLSSHDRNGGEEWAEKALSLVATRFPSAEFENWPICASYLPHSEAVLSFKFGTVSDERRSLRAKLLLNTSWYLEQQGSLSSARTQIEDSFQLREKALGPEHRETIASQERLAFVVMAQSDYPLAHKHFRQVINLREKLFGK